MTEPSYTLLQPPNTSHIRRLHPLTCRAQMLYWAAIFFLVIFFKTFLAFISFSVMRSSRFHLVTACQSSFVIFFVKHCKKGNNLAVISMTMSMIFSSGLQCTLNPLVHFYVLLYKTGISEETIRCSERFCWHELWNTNWAGNVLRLYCMFSHVHVKPYNYIQTHSQSNPK